MPSNRELVTEAFASWSNGTGYVTSIFAEDMTWEIVGHSAASRNASSIVIVLWDGSGMTTIGTRYDNTYAWFMTLRDGAVVDGTACYDSISFNELWANVSPGTQ